MGFTWERLLEALVETRDSTLYRNDPEHDRARRDNLEFIVQTILEKLRDADNQANQFCQAQQLSPQATDR